MQHALKNDPAMRDLKHVQADSPGLAYLFFHDQHRYRSLSKEEALAMCSHIADAFAEWIGRSVHFNMQSPYCWKQDNNVWQLCKKGTGNGFDLSKNLYCLCK